MKPFKPSALNKTFLSRVKDLKIKQPIDGDHTNMFSTEAIESMTKVWMHGLPIKPVIMFSGFWPHGQFLRESKCFSGGKYVPCTYLSECYAYSQDGYWYKLMKPVRADLYPTWFNIGTNDLPTKEYLVKAMLMKESF